MLNIASWLNPPPLVSLGCYVHVFCLDVPLRHYITYILTMNWCHYLPISKHFCLDCKWPAEHQKERRLHFSPHSHDPPVYCCTQTLHTKLIHSNYTGIVNTLNTAETTYIRRKLLSQHTNNIINTKLYRNNWFIAKIIQEENFLVIYMYVGK